MTVQYVQCHVEGDCTGHTDIQMMWKGYMDADVEVYGVDMWQLTVQ
jgi:hypothetical protein